MSWSTVKYASWGAASLMGAALLAGPAFADGMPSHGRISSAPEGRTCSTSGNVGVTSDYVFRGFSQTQGDAALQGGVDLTCGNFYVGFWGSNVEFFPFAADSNVEIDVYAGYRFKTGRINWDLGAIYYSYPGTNTFGGAFPHNDYFEVKLGASTEIWKGGTLGGTVFYSPDYFAQTGHVWTFEGTFSQSLPKVAMFSPTFSATVGHSTGVDSFLFGLRDSYTYWNAGVTLGFREKWSLDLRYWDTDLPDSGFCDVLHCDQRFVATLKYTF
jgi:uncharacterized protein (TIGR02001 family)